AEDGIRAFHVTGVQTCALPILRLEDEANQKQCFLVLMGATPDGRKELIAVQDGYRESEQSWLELLTDLKQRGLASAPKIAVGDRSEERRGGKERCAMG